MDEDSDSYELMNPAGNPSAIKMKRQELQEEGEEGEEDVYEAMQGIVDPADPFARSVSVSPAPHDSDFCISNADDNNKSNNADDDDDSVASGDVGDCLCNRVWCCPCVVLVAIGVVAFVSIAASVWSIIRLQQADRFCTAKAIEDLKADLMQVINTTVSNSVGPLQTNFEEMSQAFSTHLSVSPVESCLEVYRTNPTSPSGEYWVRAASSDRSAVHVYCDMSRPCGDVTGGWMRVASLDFESTSSSCPAGLRERNDSNIRTCGIDSTSPACASVLFDTYSIPYTRVCGRILAYQFGTPNAFGTPLTIDSIYVDGVSLTHGSNPRHHIWTFAAALDEYGQSPNEVCDCSNTRRSGELPQSFVESNYFCDSGVPRTFEPLSDLGRFFGSSPLWDGSGCGSNSTCCQFNDPPWFNRVFAPSISDSVEMRVCTIEGNGVSDIALSSVEIYVQ